MPATMKVGLDAMTVEQVQVVRQIRALVIVIALAALYLRSCMLAAGAGAACLTKRCIAIEWLSQTLTFLLQREDGLTAGMGGIVERKRTTHRMQRA